jgi:probable F420-dependent oxidoreductase
VNDDGPRSVLFGMRLPVQAQSTAYAEPWESGGGAHEIVSVARVAEHSGLAYVAVGDHVAVPKIDAGELSTTWFDCVATLSFVAAATHRVRLLSHGYAPALRHPLAAAKQWATLDALSGGRAILGVGCGGLPGEFAALDVDHGGRDAALDEALDALRAALDAEFSSHHGPRWSYDDMGISPRPCQPRLPVWIAGSTDAALRRAAERADGWVPSGPPEGGMTVAIARLRELLERQGRAGEPFTVGVRSGPLYIGEPRWDVGRAVHGSAEQVASFLRVLAGLGVDQIEVAFRSRDVHELYDQIRVFGADVAPLVELSRV